MAGFAGRRFVAIGSLAGLAGGLLGVGGGFLMVPLQIVWAGVSTRRAGGNSLAAIVPVAVVGAAIYYFGGKAPQLDVAVAVWVMIGSSAGSFAGSELSRRVPERMLRFVMIALLVAGAAKELSDALIATGPGGTVHFDTLHYALLALAGFVIGCVAGLTGVGGGILLVPTLVLAFGVGQRIAQGTSLVAILPTAAIGALVHFRHGSVEPARAGWLALGGVPASVVGAIVALWLPQRVLAGLFGLLLLAMTVRLWREATTEGPPSTAAP